MIQTFVESRATIPDLAEKQDQIVNMLPRLRRFCMVLTGSVDAGDDLAQSTIERALKRINLWQQGTRLDSWMFRIARNINIDEARARSRRGAQIEVSALDSEIGDDGRLITERRSILACARQAMATLSEDQRSLMSLVVIEGISYREAADALGIPIGTVMSRIARARRFVAAFVDEGASRGA